MDNIIPVEKPPGISTYELIRCYKKEHNFKGKIGHAGTLDPFAQGLVLLLLNKATKRFNEIQTWEKVYLAKIVLGQVSSTGDTEGEIKQISSLQPEEKELKKILKLFIGETEQRIPAFSAAKHKGVPLYKLARKGIKIEKKKKVKIRKIDFIKYQYPFLEIRVFCSSGTYIRQLAEDIGEKIKTGAYLTFLKREKIGEFDKRAPLC